ncbi:hypothetical protein HK101_005489, partial [Irineochytrium annulatum]
MASSTIGHTSVAVPAGPRPGLHPLVHLDLLHAIAPHLHPHDLARLAGCSRSLRGLLHPPSLAIARACLDGFGVGVGETRDVRWDGLGRMYLAALFMRDGFTGDTLSCLRFLMAERDEEGEQSELNYWTKAVESFLRVISLPCKQSATNQVFVALPEDIDVDCLPTIFPKSSIDLLTASLLHPLKAPLPFPVELDNHLALLHLLRDNEAAAHLSHPDIHRRLDTSAVHAAVMDRLRLATDDTALDHLFSHPAFDPTSDCNAPLRASCLSNLLHPVKRLLSLPPVPALEGPWRPLAILDAVTKPSNDTLAILSLLTSPDSCFTTPLAPSPTLNLALDAACETASTELVSHILSTTPIVPIRPHADAPSDLDHMLIRACRADTCNAGIIAQLTSSPVLADPCTLAGLPLILLLNRLAVPSISEADRLATIECVEAILAQASAGVPEVNRDGSRAHEYEAAIGYLPVPMFDVLRNTGCLGAPVDTWLLLACRRSGSAALVRHLVSLGLPMPGNEGIWSRCLCAATLTGDADVVGAVIECGGSGLNPSRNGNEALGTARALGFERVVGKLMEDGR